MHKLKSILLALITFSLPGTAQSIDETDTLCSSEHHRAFDFLIGEWNVFSNEDGSLQGIEQVSTHNHHCLIDAFWQQQNDEFKPVGSVHRLQGHAYSISDGKTWRMLWADNGGRFITFKSARVDNSMVMTSQRTSPLIYQWHWTPQNDGSILSIGYFSSDRGENCLLYTSPSPRDLSTSRMPSSA